MIIGRRIRSLNRHLHFVREGTHITLGVPLQDIPGTLQRDLGYRSPPQPGDSLLPAILGPVSRFNASGKAIVRRDLPMETAWRQHYWTRMEWRGSYPPEEVSSTVDIPYQRYPRDYVPPPSIELEAAITPDGTKLLTVPEELYSPANTTLLHKANLLLELFGQFEVYQQDLTPIIRGQRRSVNWEILPPGKLLPHQRRNVLDALTEELTPEHKRIFEERFQLIYEFEPAFHVVGNGGFKGYIVFGFTDHDFHILECSRYGNATYVLGKNWPFISQMTKAEILSRNAHQDRLIHNKAWERELRNLFNYKPAVTAPR